MLKFSGTTGVAMAKRKGEETTRLELIVPKSLIARVDLAALRLGMNRSTFVRMAILERLEREEGRPEKRPSSGD